MRRCIGCGALLQDTNPKEIGYTPNLERDYCQRCFRLIHYDDLTFSMKQSISSDMVMKEIEEMDASIFWVVDCFDLEAGMIPGLSRKFVGKELVFVGTKFDLFPSYTNLDHIQDFIEERLQEYGIQVSKIYFVSDQVKESVDALREEILRDYVSQTIVLMGKANSGKSTLLNHLLENNELTSSRYPGTTLDFNVREMGDVTIVDSPGIEVEHSYLIEVKEEELKKILPTSTIKPRIYQLHSSQSFAIGGLARIGITVSNDASAIFYVKEDLLLHRTKIEQADHLWEEHYGELLSPIPQDSQITQIQVKPSYPKMDIVFDGLGWVCVMGNVNHVKVVTPKNVRVTFRKAML